MNAYEPDRLLEEFEFADAGASEEEAEPFLGNLGGGATRAIDTTIPRLAGLRRGRPHGLPTLRLLASFSQRFVRNLIALNRRVDCADLAIALWISFAAQNRVPVTFRIWIAAERRYRDFGRRHFRTSRAFIRFVQRNLGARGLIDNTYSIAGGQRAAVPGDVYLWEYFHERTNRRHRWGHTQIIDRVIRSPSGPGQTRSSSCREPFHLPYRCSGPIRRRTSRGRGGR